MHNPMMIIIITVAYLLHMGFDYNFINYNFRITLD